jgi:hypothetical protein
MLPDDKKKPPAPDQEPGANEYDPEDRDAVAEAEKRRGDERGATPDEEPSEKLNPEEDPPDQP